jgi:hypothetical protein
MNIKNATIFYLIIANISVKLFGMSYPSGPVCKPVNLAIVEYESDSTYKVFVMEKKDTIIVIPKPFNDSNTNEFIIDSVPTLGPVEIEYGKYEDFVFNATLDYSPYVLVFVSDSMPSFCRAETEEEVKKSKED